MARILVVDDELSIIEVLKTLLARGGHSVSTASNGNEALRLLKEEVFDLMITDVCLPGIDGITLLHQSKNFQNQLAVIVMTAYAGIESAVEAMKNGAFDYITKPFKFDELMITIQRALSYETAIAENKLLKHTLKTKYHFGNIVGDSEKMLEIYRLIEKVAKTNSTVLILGESGTGKELIAKALHNESPRKNNAFVTINCSAMPETLLESELFGYVKGAFTGAATNKKGLFETAEDGTIFLDEIGSIPVTMQMKLLRVLQEKEIRRVGGTENIPVNVRVVAATNENLQDKIRKGEFREDLYFRLSVIPIHIPPLRERKDDIPMLIQHFLTQFDKENHRLIAASPDAVYIMSNYRWPGNVRQLENLVKRLATLNDSGTIEVSELPQDMKESLNSHLMDNTMHQTSTVQQSAHPAKEIIPLKNYIKKIEDSYIRKTIEDCGGSKEEAASRLDISLATLYRKIGQELK